MNTLKAGDILVFKVGDDWMGKCIAWLTESDVSHAAIIMAGTSIVEMGQSGISMSHVTALDGDNAIVLRLRPEKDVVPIVRETQKYVDSKTRYDFPALALLAGLIIYRRIPVMPELVAITDIILRTACMQLDKLIHQLILKNPDKAMVCSQLVYHIYEDCGKGYHIAIDNGLLHASGDADRLLPTGIRLADLAIDAPELDMAFLADAASPDEEALAQELYAALTEADTAEALDFAALDLGELPSLTKRFMEKLEEFLEKSKSGLPIGALFITPADLAYKAKNLETVFRANIVRSR